MTLRFRIEVADFQALLESVATGGSPRAGEGFARPLFRNLAIAFGVGFVGTLLVATVSQPLPRWVVPAVLGFLAAAVSGAALVAVAQARSRRRGLPLPEGSIVGDQVLEIGPQGITQSYRHHRGETRWAGVIEVRNARNHLFIMVDSCAGYIVPKRVFADPHAERVFVETVERFRSEAGRSGASPAPPT
jgi:hypothetical protein